MTNGEKIKEIFPNMNFGTLTQDDVIVNKDYSNNDEPQVFIPKRVWNAEYKEPTTKNCRTCRNFGSYHGICEIICKDNKCWTEKEPTTKNDLGVDCISRDAVKYYIQAHIHEIITESGIDKNAHTNGVLRALLNGVDTMPSVTPIRPKGHWIYKEYDEETGMKGVHFCSECGYPLTSPYISFCSVCGADMREVENE